MNRFEKLSTNALIRLYIELENERERSYFYSFNPSGGCYTEDQKKFAIEKSQSIGVRATSRLLQVPRKTIQRWLRKIGITVKRCPDWVFDWAYMRKKRMEQWKRINSYRK